MQVNDGQKNKKQRSGPANVAQRVSRLLSECPTWPDHLPISCPIGSEVYQPIPYQLHRELNGFTNQLKYPGLLFVSQPGLEDSSQRCDRRQDVITEIMCKGARHGCYTLETHHS